MHFCIMLYFRSVQLTESGERFIDDVIAHVFQFINLLKTSGPLQWFYEELKYLTEQQFEQQDAERPQYFASNLAVSFKITIFLKIRFSLNNCLIPLYTSTRISGRLFLFLGGGGGSGGVEFQLM